MSKNKRRIAMIERTLTQDADVLSPGQVQSLRATLAALQSGTLEAPKPVVVAYTLPAADVIAAAKPETPKPAQSFDPSKARRTQAAPVQPTPVVRPAVQPAQAMPAGMRRMPAKFPGSCRGTCGGRINVGDVILWAPFGAGARHEACA